MDLSAASHEPSRMCVRQVEALTRLERDQMFALLAASFVNANSQKFERDLNEKEWVFLMTAGSTEQIVGFSTLMKLQTIVDAQPVIAFFSGDLVVDHEYWGEAGSVGIRFILQHIFQLAAAAGEARPYWLLNCSTYRTYRWLPVLFHDFYPNHERPTPAPVKRVLDTVARLNFGSAYDATCGIVRIPNAKTAQPATPEATEEYLKDPHIAFFFTANPGYSRGDDLACLAELTPENLTPLSRRLITRDLSTPAREF